LSGPIMFFLPSRLLFQIKIMLVDCEYRIIDYTGFCVQHLLKVEGQGNDVERIDVEIIDKYALLKVLFIVNALLGDNCLEYFREMSVCLMCNPFCWSSESPPKNQTPHAASCLVIHIYTHPILQSYVYPPIHPLIQSRASPTQSICPYPYPVPVPLHRATETRHKLKRSRLRLPPLRCLFTTPSLKYFSSPAAVLPPIYHFSAPNTSLKPSELLSLPLLVLAIYLPPDTPAPTPIAAPRPGLPS